MLSITTIINGLSTIATAVDRIHERKRTKLESERNPKSEDLARFKELAEADLEQERLIGELSDNVQALAKVIDTEMEKNRKQNAKLGRLVYASCALGLLALIISIFSLVH